MKRPWLVFAAVSFAMAQFASTIGCIALNFLIFWREERNPYDFLLPYTFWTISVLVFPVGYIGFILAFIPGFLKTLWPVLFLLMANSALWGFLFHRLIGSWLDNRHWRERFRVDTIHLPDDLN